MGIQNAKEKWTQPVHNWGQNISISGVTKSDSVLKSFCIISLRYWFVLALW
jgi:hypothetical protein